MVIQIVTYLSELMICILALLLKTPSKLKPFKELVLNKYHDFLSLFSKKKVSILLQHQYVDYEIPLLLGAKLPLSLMYFIYSKLKEVRE